MSGRLVPLGAAIALTVALVLALGGAVMIACYDIPRPDCGFLCGPDNACPDDYTCADDHRCHRNGAPAGLICPTPDAAADGPPDAPPDATPDAPADAMPDAPADAGPDAMPDAAPDAMPDAAPP
ncbi:MAG TPA: hypothetical protein VH165_13585 [Kofleriaceae bacterium]|nr:hypothetical protein [Kofleriaceae bacterium]